MFNKTLSTTNFKRSKSMGDQPEINSDTENFNLWSLTHGQQVGQQVGIEPDVLHTVTAHTAVALRTNALNIPKDGTSRSVNQRPTHLEDLPVRDDMETDWDSYMYHNLVAKECEESNNFSRTATIGDFNVDNNSYGCTCHLYPELKLAGNDVFPCHNPECNWAWFI
ncbi:MAG: hypothetical protein SFT93_04005 [Rickettsiaceae bacterium]|nr:hypothetical protein [Rickettsiaceae bacterium]